MNETNPTYDYPHLIELLEKQQKLYRSLRTLADRQRTLVIQDDSRPLLELLAERQKLVDELVGVSARLAAYRRDWTSVFKGLDEASRKRVTDLLEEANNALGSILQNDSKDTATLTTKRQEVGDRLATVRSGSRVSAAYAAAGAGNRTSMTDAKG
jgi:hypothetical protein